jgi:hypothetical protein
MLARGAFLVGTSIQTTLHAEPASEPAYLPAEARSDPAQDTGERPERREETRKDHFRIGALGGVGFPRPLAIEGLVKLERTVGLGVEYSVLPTVDLYGVETTFHAFAADVRFFPFQGPFFLGFRAGRQHLGGTHEVTMNGFSAQGNVEVDSTFVNPRMGLLWTVEPGFTVGIDAGVQIPLSSSTSSSLPQGTIANDRVMHVADSLGDSVLPTIDLLRLGFLL